MPFPGIHLSSSVSTSNSNQDSHDVTTSEANRYDQHYHSEHSGNVSKTNDSSLNIITNIINSNVNHTPANNKVLENSSQSSYPLPTPIETLPGIETVPQHLMLEGKKDNIPELQIEILVSKMKPEMEEFAKNAIILAFVKVKDAMMRAKHISDLFEEKYEESWNCVTGSDFASFVRYLNDLYIHLKVANQRVLIFKTPKLSEETEIKQPEELLKMAVLPELEQALIVESRFGNVEKVTNLLKAGAKHSAQDVMGWTPILAAACKNKTKVVKLLLDHGADPNIKNKWGDTTLIWATHFNNVEMAAMLREKGASLDFWNGKTVMHFAAYREGVGVDIIKYYLSLGVNVNAKDKKGWTPLKHAIDAKKTDVAQFLRSRGATE